MLLSSHRKHSGYGSVREFMTMQHVIEKVTTLLCCCTFSSHRICVSGKRPVICAHRHSHSARVGRHLVEGREGTGVRGGGGALRVYCSLLWYTQCTWKTKAGEGMGVFKDDDDARISSILLLSCLSQVPPPPNPPAQFHFTAGM